MSGQISVPLEGNLGDLMDMGLMTHVRRMMQMAGLQEVCMCVCMYVCMYVCETMMQMAGLQEVCMYVCMYVCVYVCM